MGPMIFGHCELRDPLEQGRHGSYVLACLSEVWEILVILNDPPVHVAGVGV
jgi:hypothetical protein